MYDFDFLRPKNVKEVCAILASFGNRAKLIAGGTDILVDMHKGKFPVNIEALIDISSLNELNFIKEDGDFIRIGANVTHSQIASSSLIKNYAPLLAKASHSLGSPQIRNRGTIAGNIVNAAPCSDTAPPLVVLKAILVIIKASRKRELPIENFFTKPNTVNMEPEEMLYEIYFKKLSEPERSTFLRLSRRNALTKSRMSLSVVSKQDNEKIVKDIRISAGSITPTPCRFTEAEEQLLGNIPTKESFKKAAELISKEMIDRSGYRWSTEYKKPVIEELALRAFNEILEVAQ